MGGLRPSEIRATKEAFLRALILSIIFAVLTNTLSFFWAIGGEAWFGDHNLYSAPPSYEYYEERMLSRSSIQASRGESSLTSPQETSPQPIFKESEEHSNFQPVENIFQYIIQSIKKFFESIF